MTIGIALFIAGITQIFVGWFFYRLPGIQFWTVAPIWRAAQYLSAPGIALWVGGLVLMWVGGAIHFYSYLM